MAAKDDLGKAGEDRAVAYLIGDGYRILARNWRCPQGEIDVVAERDGTLVVVEVKTRRSEDYGHPFEAVDRRKAERLWRLSMAWLSEHPQHARGRRLRVDVIGLVGDDPAHARLEHLEDAL
ncbi:YraN family protein [uncultured Microbacterium sp.]|uniref:YraN family protein n=1 Tax=uncultured Microbacterium sp. TaxID=191216 RepID=UPI00262205A3|nr:YraN family protein [uncultured Microbacterium sp.]